MINSAVSMPRVLKVLLWLIGGISLGSGLLDWVFHSALGIPGPQQFLALSSWGIAHGLLYQPLSYWVVYQAAGGIHLGMLITLAFHLYLLYICGSQILHITGEKGFLKLFFGSVVSAGMMGLLLLWLSGARGAIAGAGPAVFGVMWVWCMLYPNLQLMLFMMIPILARWLVLGFLGIQVLLTLSNGDIVTPMVYLTGSFAGYAYGVLACDLSGPFPQLWALDRFLRRFQRKTEQLSNIVEKAKVYDIRTGEAIVDDDAFMDAMLEKIAKGGRESLNSKEKRRMEEISKKRRR